VCPPGWDHTGYVETSPRIDVKPDSVPVLGEALPHRGSVRNAGDVSVMFQGVIECIGPRMTIS